MRKLTINLPKALVQRARTKALRNGVTLTRTIETLLEAWLKRPAKEER